MNTLKTGILLAGLTILFVLLGRAVGGQGGMVIAFVLAMVMNFGAYWFSDKIVLRMYDAQPITRQEAPELYQMVARLCERARLPMPALYVIPDPTPNAFATGRDPQHAAVAVNQGLLQMLNHEEVEGVVAHELAHVKNRDTLITTVAATIAGAITMIAHFAQYAAIFGGMRGDDEEGGSPLGVLALAIVAPIAAMILQLAISRSREYAADRTGGAICGRPLALASALRKLEMAAHARPMARVEPATASLFIVNPLAGGGVMALFSTHPPMAERIARLEAQAREMAGGQRALGMS